MTAVLACCAWGRLLHSLFLSARGSVGVCSHIAFGPKLTFWGGGLLAFRRGLRGAFLPNLSLLLPVVVLCVFFIEILCYVLICACAHEGSLVVFSNVFVISGVHMIPHPFLHSDALEAHWDICSSIYGRLHTRFFHSGVLGEALGVASGLG